MSLITSQYGFLPHNTCNTLPESFCKSESFPGLEEIVKALTKENVNEYSPDEFRSIVEELDNEFETLPSLESLELNQVQYLCLLATYASHKYVWCSGLDDSAKDEIPDILAVLWQATCEILGLKTVLTYATSVLYNWKFKPFVKVTNTTELTINNIETIFSFTGTEDEENFILTMTVAEQYSGSVIRLFNDLQKTVESGNSSYLDTEVVVDSLNKLNELIMKMFNLLKNFGNENKCDPKFFYWTLRKYISGFNNIKIHPKGVKINEDYYNYEGGSGAQSSFYYFLDTIFGIKHSKHEAGFLKTTLTYMPQKDQEFLAKAKNLPTIKDIVTNVSVYDGSIEKTFDECLNVYSKFRNMHYSIAHRYITKQDPSMVKGTQGTKFEIFLKDMRKDTIDCKIASPSVTESKCQSCFDNFLKPDSLLWIFAVIFIFLGYQVDMWRIS